MKNMLLRQYRFPGSICRVDGAWCESTELEVVERLGHNKPLILTLQDITTELVVAPIADPFVRITSRIVCREK
ncbi:hypothetical protein D9M71_817270 [compost metagenome]